MSVSKLIADLDAEFGKKPRPAKKVDVRTQTIVGRSSTGTLSDMLAEANETSRSWNEVPGFRAIRRITNIQHEHCRTCGGSVSFIGNCFTEFESKRLKSKVQAAELVLVDEFGLELPHHIDEWHHDVEQCVSCIHLSRKVEDLLVHFDFSRPQMNQLHLFKNGANHEEAQRKTQA